MPRLSDTLRSNQPVQGYVPAELPEKPPMQIDNPILTPVRNRYIRCPIPPVWTANSDSLRQFDVGGAVPQYRTYPQSLLK